MANEELKQSVVQHAKADMAADPLMWVDPPEPPSTAPTTSSVMWGLWREGLKDLQNAVFDPWGGQVATHEEAGTIANPTQAMVTQDVGTVYGHHAYLDQAAAEMAKQPEHEMEMER